MANASRFSLRFVWLLSVVATAGCFNPDESDDVVDTGAEGTSSGGGEADDSSGGEAVEVCPDYCSLIGDHCQGDNAQYDGNVLCEATCANIPEGVAGDELGNTAACRTFHAVLAAEDPDTHCPHAGPAGDGTCGANCESFCSIALSTCEGDLSPFSGAEDCISACEAFPAEPPYSATVPDGDNFECRLRHLTLASLQPEVHCSHIGTDSPVCTD